MAECRNKGYSRSRKPGTRNEKILIEDMYQAELDTHLGYSKNGERPEESENYRNGSYHKFVKTKDGELELIYSFQFANMY